MADGAGARSFEPMTRHSPTDLDGGRSPAPVRLKRITKRYGPILAVDDLSFAIRPGAVTGFLGPNGAGKTTALRVLLGLAEPTSGTATIFGRGYAQLDDPLGTVGALLETSTFHPWRSARNHLRILARAAGIAGERVDQVLAGVGLSGAADRRVGGFSLGMRQRLGLAAALLGRPRVLVLDEPANGLDPEGIHWLRDLLRGYAADGNSVLISSHLLSEVAQTVDDVIIIAGGRTRAQCSLRELEARTTGTVEVRSAQAAELGGRLAALGIEATASGLDGLTVTGTTADAVGEVAALGGIALSAMTTTRSDLERVFLELTSATTDMKEAA
jgi:ABC-2 type transport system ATP-binding protein